ncbi:Mannose-6-phosphate isomerase [Abortiporus biennis]
MGRQQFLPSQRNWGKKGSSSLVATLANNAVGPDRNIDRNAPYAEVWVGTHPNGPAHLFHDSQELLSLIRSNPPHFLGNDLLERWPETTHVPFLFKVLSIAKALPLQAHSDKELAKDLHNENPDEFVDANHKPKIAIAIGDKDLNTIKWGEGIVFTGFVGFRPLDDIGNFADAVPELADAIGNEALVESFIAHPSKDGLKKIFSSLLTRSTREKDSVQKAVRNLADKVKSGYSFGKLDRSGEVAKLVVAIDDQYPGDVGILATPFFMNFVKLRRGQSIYIGADEIHAYLEGHIIECMSVSDNVLNAAFAPTSQTTQHIPTFLDMLTYTSRDPVHWLLEPSIYSHSINKSTNVYRPPLEEFVVLGTSLSKERASGKEVLESINGPMIGIVIKGNIKVQVEDESEKVSEGGIVYVVPNKEVLVELVKGGKGEVWWAASMSRIA